MTGILITLYELGFMRERTFNLHKYYMEYNYSERELLHAKRLHRLSTILHTTLFLIIMLTGFKMIAWLFFHIVLVSIGAGFLFLLTHLLFNKFVLFLLIIWVIKRLLFKRTPIRG